MPDQRYSVGADPLPVGGKSNTAHILMRARYPALAPTPLRQEYDEYSYDRYRTDRTLDDTGDG